jgi:hypothetical protein
MFYSLQSIFDEGKKLTGLICRKRGREEQWEGAGRGRGRGREGAECLWDLLESIKGNPLPANTDKMIEKNVSGEGDRI